MPLMFASNLIKHKCIGI